MAESSEETDGKARGFEDAVFDDRSPQLDRFGLLLAVTAVTIVLQMLIDLTDPVSTAGKTAAGALLTAAAGATVLLAFRASGVSRRWTRAADILVGIGIAAFVFVLFVGLVGDNDAFSSTDAGPGPVLYLILSILATLVVVRRLLTHRRAAASTLMGAIAAYLLIAVAFNYAFLTTNALSNVPFFGAPEPTTSYMYFSLVSITTTGYGDLAAVTEMGRLLASTEFVVGQVFLVTFVAVIVGMVVQSRQGADESAVDP